MKYIISILLVLQAFTGNAQTALFGTTSTTGTSKCVSKIKVTYYGAGDSVLLMVRPSDSTIVAVSKYYYASSEYVDSLFNTIGSHDSLVKYEDSISNVYVSGYRLDTFKTNIRAAKADKATTITINGVTYDLSANRTWTVGAIDSFVRNESTYQTGATFHTLTGKVGNVPVDSTPILIVYGDSRSIKTNYVPDTTEFWMYRVARHLGATLMNLSVSGDALAGKPFNQTNGWSKRSSIPRQSDYPNNKLYFIYRLSTNDIIANQITASLYADTLDMLMTYVNSDRGIQVVNCLASTAGYIATYSNYGSGAADTTRHRIFNDSTKAKATSHGWKIYDDRIWEFNRGAGKLLRSADGLHEITEGQRAITKGIKTALDAKPSAKSSNTFTVNGKLEAKELAITHPDSADPSHANFLILTDSGKVALASSQPILANPTAVRQPARVYISGVINTDSSITGDTITGNYLYNTYGVYARNNYILGTQVAAPSTGLYGFLVLNTSLDGLEIGAANAGTQKRVLIKGSGMLLSDGTNYGDGIGLDVYGTADIATTLKAGTSLTSPILYGSASANGTLKLRGTSDGTVATSYVSLSDNGGVTLNGSTTNDGSGREFQNTGQIGSTDTIASNTVVQAAKFKMTNPTRTTTADSLLRYNSSTNMVEVVAAPSGATTAYVDSTTAGMSPMMPHRKFVGISTQTSATGDLDLYTCPTGKRALIHNIFHYNASAGNITVYYQIKVSGTYYRLTTSTTPATNTVANHAVTIILEAGESIAVNTTTNTGLNIQAAILEFDNTSNLKTKKILGTSTGDNTIYTCPASTNAMITPLFLPTGTSNNNVNFVADGGGARTITYNDVLSGGSVSTANKIVQAFSTAASARTSFTMTLGFNSGDFLNLNVSTGDAAQIAWINIMELPN